MTALEAWAERWGTWPRHAATAEALDERARLAAQITTTGTLLRTAALPRQPDGDPRLPDLDQSPPAHRAVDLTRVHQHLRRRHPGSRPPLGRGPPRPARPRHHRLRPGGRAAPPAVRPAPCPNLPTDHRRPRPHPRRPPSTPLGTRPGRPTAHRSTRASSTWPSIRSGGNRSCQGSPRAGCSPAPTQDAPWPSVSGSARPATPRRWSSPGSPPASSADCSDSPSRPPTTGQQTLTAAFPALHRAPAHLADAADLARWGEGRPYRAPEYWSAFVHVGA